ncbi:DUF4956 domain-containing protein [Propioniciclava sp.]|uniref:DUF4956 domain-containing protein n=1 Tax=Propioniciclava sp. TaxID=2038686 RepID=UPI00260673D0|nr:DUF4956 domain-containing protein [Propioniciclava sp.]
MTTAALLHFGLDVVAILALVIGVYFPRHHRRDLLVAYIGVNLGVMAVSSVLLSTAVGAGLGLGLFGVLSIIRLRSDELAQHEVAYYFAALALGLIAGLGSDIVVSGALMAVVVATLYIADHPRVLSGWQRQVLVLDRAIADQTALVAALEQRLGARVLSAQTIKLDLVTDTTTVDVRFRAGQPATARLEEVAR